MPLSIDVVIPTWEGRDMLLRCLRRLAEQDVEHRVIVVDNASTDATAAAVAAEHPGVTVLAMPENVGFGRAVNAGARHGDGDVIVLINNDVEVEPGFLAAIRAPLEA